MTQIKSWLSISNEGYKNSYELIIKLSKCNMVEQGRKFLVNRRKQVPSTMKYFIGLVLGMACFEILCYLLKYILYQKLEHCIVKLLIKSKDGIWKNIRNNAVIFLVLFLLKCSRIYGGKSCDMLVVVDETLFVSFNRDVGTDEEIGFSGIHLFKLMP